MQNERIDHVSEICDEEAEREGRVLHLVMSLSSAMETSPRRRSSLGSVTVLPSLRCAPVAGDTEAHRLTDGMPSSEQRL
jgi:hypothetical protein